MLILCSPANLECPFLAKGRTNMELREKFILPEGTTQVMASFRYRGRKSRPSSRAASPNRSCSSQSCAVPPCPAVASTPKVRDPATQVSSFCHSLGWSLHQDFPLIYSFILHYLITFLPYFCVSSIWCFSSFLICDSMSVFFDLPLFPRLPNTYAAIMISPGLQTANHPLLLNHQTPLRAKVHPQRYSHIQNMMWDASQSGPDWNLPHNYQIKRQI